MLPYVDKLNTIEIFSYYDRFYHFYESDYNKILELVMIRANNRKFHINITNNATLFNPKATNFAGHKSKLARLDLNPKWLTVSVFHYYDHFKYLDYIISTSSSYCITNYGLTVSESMN